MVLQDVTASMNMRKVAIFILVVGIGTLVLVYNFKKELVSMSKSNVPPDLGNVSLVSKANVHVPPDLGNCSEWSCPKRQYEYNSRFWDLVKATDPKLNYSPKTPPIFRKNRTDNLWGPVEGQNALNGEANTRIVSQMVWLMEEERFFKEEMGRTETKTKTILIADGFSLWYTFLSLSPADCDVGNSITKCAFTENMSDIAHFDAIVAHHAPLWVWSTDAANVSPSVLKFFLNMESPFHSGATFTRSTDLLVNYWRGADVIAPYGKWVPYGLNHTSPRKAKRDYSKGKSKPAAAFISNCNPSNDRGGYINELRKYITVDIYGQCGDKKCKRYTGLDCFGMLKRDYYFYLSFENSNCRDYITEKFFENGLKYDLIPIVMGAHPDDYKAVAPEGSYIHVEDFPSPKELAERMTFLIKNPQEYNKYFAWKGTGEFFPSNQLCEICAMVHYADVVPPPNRDKPFRWGEGQAVSDGMCLEKGQWYWNRTNHPTHLATGNSGWG